MTESTAPSMTDSTKGAPVPRSLLGGMAKRLLGRWGAALGIAWVVCLAALSILAPLLATSFPLLIREAGGGLRSPALEAFAPADAVLIAVGLAALVVWFMPARLGGTLPQRLAALVWLAAIIAPLASWKPVVGVLSGPEVSVLTMIVLGAGAAACLVLIVGLPWLTKAPGSLDLTIGTMALGWAIVLLAFPVNPPAVKVYPQFREAAQAGQIEILLHAPIPYSPNDRTADAALPVIQKGPGWHFSESDLATEVRKRARLAATSTGLGVVDAKDPEIQAKIEAMVQDAYAQASAHQASGTPIDELAPIRADPEAGRASRRMIAIAATAPNQRFHLMGTTADGEDLASRMIHACRIALAIGFIATGIAIVIGVFVGGLMGYFSGVVDLLGMRLVEVFSAIPVIYLLIAIVAFYGRNLYLMMIILGLTGWVGFALFVRAEFLKLRQADYVQAARAAGVPLGGILFRHMLPNGLTPILVSASFGVAGAILTESTLSFLGLGLVEEPSWGQMLNQARSAGGVNWWLLVFPTLAIFLTVFAYNLVGEALRDVMDPRTADSD